VESPDGSNEEDGTTVKLTWQTPKYANGEIEGINKFIKS
jgi:hypothetical protein